MGRYDRTDRERFDEKWIPEPNTGCWLWMASKGPKGYGAFWIPGACTNNAHRHAWALYKGPIPAGMHIDHICRVRSCVNPDHLRLVTPRQNALENNCGPVAANAARARCPKCGGIYSPVPYRTGQRFCIPCDAEARNDRYIRKSSHRKRRFARTRFAAERMGQKATDAKSSTEN